MIFHLPSSYLISLERLNEDKTYSGKNIFLQDAGGSAEDPGFVQPKAEEADRRPRGSYSSS